MTDSRLNTIAQIILAMIFGVGLIAFLFALVFSSTKMDQITVTIVSNLLSVLATVIVMQNSHFFKSSVPDQQNGSPLAPLEVGSAYVPPTPSGAQPNVQLSTASVPAGTPRSTPGSGTAP